MTPSTPGAKVPCWRTRIKGAWLIKIGSDLVHTLTDAQDAFKRLFAAGATTATLLFSHPKIRHDISHNGLPIMSSAPFHQRIHDQLNRLWDFSTVVEHLQKQPSYMHINDGDVINCVTRAMKLTCGKLLQQTDWSDWQDSEYLQLDQYAAQGMFGEPVPTSGDDAIFYLVWTYTIKAVDEHKKA
jgi:hypothetical protein